ncbi:baseplate J protein [Gordonia phage Skog]|uniref:Baseplate J protein n=1 Tax=Gordonia phage Skog TaxID=2704033 RepID=A0A6G6XK03_9CAUD|nr:baseplate wedge subunit [Gordonia phage Skog]QIG58344.1 baseplate J protein [Gordonia phage Skog]
MAKTPDTIAQDIISKLKVTAPGFSLELGTPERKMVDAVSEAISECYIDQYLVGSLLDIESKSGIELEQWVATFGFGRLQGRKATGVVRVELANANPQDTALGMNTQFYTAAGLPGSASQIYYSSTQAVVIPTGSYVADIPVECTVVGTAGNVGPDSVVFAGSILGASSVTNMLAMTGGVDVETDDELRQRFKDTFLRNIAGTSDWYLGLAYQNMHVSKAVVFGPITKYATQISVPDTTLNLPVTADVKYAWADGESVFKELGQEGETFYRPIDDYNFISGTSPQISRVPTGEMEVDEVVDVEFQYTTRSSRNDPVNGITNKVDMFVNGVDPYTVTERTVVPAQTLSGTPSNPLHVGKFARVGSPGTPSTANRFMRLGSVPLVSFPSSVVFDGTNYQQGVHYHVLRGTTLLAGSTREVAGIEWEAAGPATGTPLTLTYTYNRVPEVLGAVVRQGKQVTTDVMVHQASYAYLSLCVSIEYDRGLVISQVNNAINERLRTFFNSVGYGAWIEMSDVTLAIRQVLGVDNVWITTAAESPENYGIRVFGDSSDVTPISVETEDFKLRDNQLPIYLETTFLRRPNR